MTRDKSFSTIIIKVNKVYVIFGDCSKAKIYCKGTIYASGILDPKAIIFTNRLKSNLINIGQICFDKVSRKVYL